jgi:hypothetical protein
MVYIRPHIVLIALSHHAHLRRTSNRRRSLLLTISGTSPAGAKSTCPQELVLAQRLRGTLGNRASLQSGKADSAKGLVAPLSGGEDGKDVPTDWFVALGVTLPHASRLITFPQGGNLAFSHAHVNSGSIREGGAMLCCYVLIATIDQCGETNAKVRVQNAGSKHSTMGSSSSSPHLGACGYFLGPVGKMRDVRG